MVRNGASAHARPLTERKECPYKTILYRYMKIAQAWLIIPIDVAQLSVSTAPKLKEIGNPGQSMAVGGRELEKLLIRSNPKIGCLLSVC